VPNTSEKEIVLSQCPVATNYVIELFIVGNGTRGRIVAISKSLHVSNTLIRDHLPLLNVTGNCLIKLSQYQQQALGIHSK
jgi:hypothetical protein